MHVMKMRQVVVARDTTYPHELKSVRKCSYCIYASRIRYQCYKLIALPQMPSTAVAYRVGYRHLIYRYRLLCV